MFNNTIHRPRELKIKRDKTLKKRCDRCDNPVIIGWKKGCRFCGWKRLLVKKSLRWPSPKGKSGLRRRARRRARKKEELAALAEELFNGFFDLY